MSTHLSAEEQYSSLAKSNGDGTLSLSLLVDGVRCAHCIQTIESGLIADPDVRHARLNFSTRRLLITWQGSVQRANDWVRLIRARGYGVNPYHSKQEQAESDREEKFLLLCLAVSGFAMGNIMLLSVALWSAGSEEMGEATRHFLHAVSALIAVPTIAFSGRPFFRSAIAALKRGQTNMDVPVSVGLILATLLSLYETYRQGEHAYFDSAVMLTFFLLVGRYLDCKARARARSVALDLLKSFHGFASRLTADGRYERVPISDIREHDRVMVAMGETIPADGVILEGHSQIDQSLLTGESFPVSKQNGDSVHAGTLNMTHPLTISVARAADDSLLSDVVRLIEKAEQGQAQYVRLADRVARMYTPVVHLLAIIAFVGWWGFVDLPWDRALWIAMTVLIITCPCALALAVPVVQVLATSRLMKQGILVKSGDALERLATIDTVFVDKTGTLTVGKPVLVHTQTMGDNSPDDVLAMAASLASGSAHPLARAISHAYDGPVVSVHDVQETPGQGVEARLADGRHIRLGSRLFCTTQPITAVIDDSAPLVTFFSVDGALAAVFCFADQLRSDAAKTIDGLHAQGLDVVLLSGDRAGPVESVAKTLGINHFFSQQTPLDKHAHLERYRTQGHHVLMVGDGLNDAPVLAGADVSMAPGTALDMAQNAADIVFMGPHLHPVAEAYAVARITRGLVRQNFMLSFGYNALAVPLAFAGLVTPLIAALAMSLSSLVVVANSYRLVLMHKGR